MLSSLVMSSRVSMNKVEQVILKTLNEPRQGVFETNLQDTLYKEERQPQRNEPNLFKFHVNLF